MPSEEIKISVDSWGPPAEAVERLRDEILRGATLRKELGDHMHRLLTLRFVEGDDERKSRRPANPTRFEAQIYDYQEEETLVVTGELREPAALTIERTDRQPLPSNEEFEAALAVIGEDVEFGALLREGRIRPFRPMPPVVTVERPDGRATRTLAVGLERLDFRERNRIVGVGLAGGVVYREPDGVAQPSAQSCGPQQDFNCPPSGGATRARVRIRQGTTTLWQFVVVRPSASSGTNGSGIELQHVRYRGKQVLYRAHVPILNVEYGADGAAINCGPTYRDWQDSETCFEAIGSDPVPGFRVCTQPARTILETGSDSGNFSGVAIYVDGSEVVLVSEMMAGWYRYISEWRFGVNGTIRPRFKFAAGNNPCTCKTHRHHVYWRLDFDIVTAGNNVVDEFNDPAIVGGQHWHRKRYEIRRPRDAGHKRKWRVSNTQTGDAYELIPGANDGNADAYGVGDLWVVRFHGSGPPPAGESDDGQGFTSNAALSRAHIDKFVTGESVENKDVVLWYAAHFVHDESDPNGPPHIVGPELRPTTW